MRILRSGFWTIQSIYVSRYLEEKKFLLLLKWRRYLKVHFTPRRLSVRRFFDCVLGKKFNLVFIPFRPLIMIPSFFILFCPLKRLKEIF